MNIEALRLKSAYIVAAAAMVLALGALGTEYVVQGSMGLGSLLAGGTGLALLVMLVVARGSQAFRYLAVSVMMAQVMALLIAARGQVWQVDLHMAFFAALAIAAMLYDVRAILLGAALVAVHHLVLGLAVEELVFYGGSGLPRIVLHAVLLVAEAAGLIWLTVGTQRLLGIASSKSDEAAFEADRVRELAQQSDAERAARNAAHDQMLHRLEQSFGQVVSAAAEGRFDSRVRADFDDETLNRLAGSVNSLIDTVQRGLDETGHVLAALAEADVTRRVEGEYAGSFATLKDSTNRVADKLDEVVGQIRTTSRALKIATGEILSGANDLSERTTKQATTIQQTSAAMEKLSRTVTSNAERAREASEVSSGVTRTAEQGGKVMGEANAAMQRITESSSKISNIIGLIDDIAFQTNLLALNASVEAARAGEAGKGFAVVAVEVRRLAQSAAEASADVKTLIEVSGAEVTTGSRLVADAARQLDGMLAAARSSNTLMDGIAGESREQAAAIEELYAAIRQLDEMTQHNAALVEETNAAIEQTESQASDLDQIVAVFHLQGEPVQAQATRSAPKAASSAYAPRPAARPAGSMRGNAALKQDWSEF